MRHDTFVIFATAPARSSHFGPRPTGAAIHAVGRLCDGELTVECIGGQTKQIEGFDASSAPPRSDGTESLNIPLHAKGFPPSIAEDDAAGADPACRSSPDTALNDGVHLAVRRLRELGYRGQPLLLALGASLCLSGTVSAQGLPPRNRRQAMLYRFEELVPMAAEEFVADCAVEGEWAYGVCVETARLLPLLEGLERAGVAIQYVCPASLLAAQFALRENKEFDAILWGTARVARDAPREGGQPQSISPTPCGSTPTGIDESNYGTELVAIYQNQPRAWHRVNDGSAVQLRPYVGAIAQIVGRSPHLLADPQSRQAMARSEQLEGNGSIPAETPDSPAASLQVTPDLTPKPVLDVPWLVLEPFAIPLFEGAVRAAELVLSGSLRPWIDLRRDALAASDRYRAVRLPLVTAYVAAVCLLVIACGVLLWRAQRYERLATASENRQTSLFQRLFPNQGNPGLVRPRLESEEQRLLGLGGEAGDLPNQPSAMVLLHQALNRLPTELRFRILSLRLSENRLYIEGQARTHGDAERLAAALRSNGGFRVEPPRTELLSAGGVAFTLNCTADLATPPKAIAAASPLGGIAAGPDKRQNNARSGDQSPAADGSTP